MTHVSLTKTAAREWAAYLRAKGRPGERNEYQSLIDLLDPPETVRQGIADLLAVASHHPNMATDAVVKYLVDRVGAMEEVDKSDVWESRFDDHHFITKESVIELLRGERKR